ncbi:MAG: polysaccharide deacetylase family protein [Dethiobacteria bacterium]
MFIAYFGSKKGAKSVIVFLAVILILGGLLVWMNPLYNYYLRSLDRTERDVFFAGEMLGGRTREEIEEIFALKFAEWQIDPVDASYNPLENTIIPELWGYKINELETINKIMSAASGEIIEPVYEPILPQITLADYPSAVIRTGNAGRKEIALMINVAWGSEFIHPMLGILEAEGAIGTFFVVGNWAGKNRELLEDIHSKGHLLANHGHTDSLVYTELNAAEIQSGLEEVNSLIFDVTGQSPHFFSPHKGEYNPLVLETVSRCGMRTVLWTLDTVDWMEPGVQKMHERVTEKIHGGAIVLMHPTNDTVSFLQEALPAIKKKGFAIVSLQELLSPHNPPPAYDLDFPK